MLPRPTIRKILRETIETDGESSYEGLDVPADEQLSWLQDLADELAQIDRVGAKLEGFYIALRIRSADSNRRDQEWFIINFFPYDGLQVTTRRTGLWLADATYKRRRKAESEVPVRNVADIPKFIEAIKSKQDRTRLRTQRNTKLAGLKQRGLKSRLTELGEEHGFSFALGESNRDVNLSIRVCGKKSAYHIAFPKGKLDAVLDQVPDLIKTLETLRTLGITFRTNNKPWQSRQGPWVEPESTSPS